MEIPDRTLISLNLVLQQFGISVATPLMVKSDPPDMDRVVSTIALMQVAHPMGYVFYVERDEIGYHVRSKTLTRHISELRKKSTRGDFIISGKRYGISKVCRKRVESVLRRTLVPNPVPFSQSEWTFLVGLWAAMNETLPSDDALQVVMADYIEFLPYIDWAEEAITLIRSDNMKETA